MIDVESTVVWNLKKLNINLATEVSTIYPPLAAGCYVVFILIL